MLAAEDTRGADGSRCVHLVEGEVPVLRAVRAALEAGLWPVVAVVGDRGDDVRGALAGLPVATVTEVGSARGPGVAIRLGLGRVRECAPAARGVVLVGCEAPAVQARQLQAVAAAVGVRPGTAAAMRRAGGLGLPAFFPAEDFAELAALPDVDGCAALLRRHAARLVEVEES